MTKQQVQRLIREVLSWGRNGRFAVGVLSWALLALSTTAASADGFARQICFGTDRHTGERNGFVAIVQQTDNSVVGPEGFVPSHPDYKPRADVGLGDDVVRFRVEVYDNVPEALTVPMEQHAEFASNLLKDTFPNPTLIMADAFAERVQGRTGYYWGELLTGGELVVYHRMEGFQASYSNFQVDYNAGVQGTNVECSDIYEVASPD